MAVYTPIIEKELLDLLEKYEIGKLKKFKGILEGIENTNYKIITSKKIYILTIFEKRVRVKDLPFFINLMTHLFNKKFSCPQPISDKNGQIINKIKEKSCVLISYLKGKKSNKITRTQCKKVGKILSSLHNKTHDFKQKRGNGLNYNQWENIFKKCKSSKLKKDKIIFSTIKNELKFLKKNWPKKLPSGIIHGDFFQDNVFFLNKKFSGVIDFYFACSDFLAYDLALAINAWCFNKKNDFVEKRFQLLIKGYENNRDLKKNEKNYLSILLRGAAMRILITRLHDQLFHPKGAFVEPKNPQDYFEILKFHQKNNLGNYLS